MRVTDEMVEALAKWLHDEVEWPEYNYPERSWPEHEGDTGQRGDGWLKIVPPDVCEQFRDIARRLPIEAALAVEGTEVDGLKLVPAKMYLSGAAISNLTFQCGYEEGGKQEYFDSVAWVGEIAADGDGQPVHGLHVYSTEYPEEGSITLAEFPAPLYATPPAGIREAPVKRAIGNGMAIAAGIVMKCWGDTVTAGEILGAAGYRTIDDLKKDGVDQYDIDLVKPALRGQS